MARVKISEHKAKSLILGTEYRGLQLREGKVPRGRWVAKVDQGVKKRFKQGLVAIDKSERDLEPVLASWRKRGFSQFILEPVFPHEEREEQYLSLERVRGGLRLLHAKEGGVDIEAHPEKVRTYIVRPEDDLVRLARNSDIPEAFLRKLFEAFERYHFSFLEINPLVVRRGEVHLLDAAVLVDSAAEFFVRGAWTDSDVVKGAKKYDAEARVEALAATTPASLKLSILNPDGSLFFLLSGGGGSIVIADEAQLLGKGGEIANYGEYSGGPTREETYLYAKEIIGLCLRSKTEKKALVIAGGVANFTDVKKTFLGIIDALREVAPALRKAKTRVFVRRGGPNEAAGLALMRDFLSKEDLLGAVYGSDTIITQAIDEAIDYV